MDYIQTSQKNGWVMGNEYGMFMPDANLSRAETATIVNRMLNRFPDENYISANMNSLKLFPDVATTYWGFAHIVESTNDHIYYYINNETAEVWISAN